MTSSLLLQPEAETFAHALILSGASTLAASVRTAVRLGVFDILARPGPDAKLSAEEIASQMPARNPDAAAMLDRLLRNLASYEAISCSPADDSNGNRRRVYGLLPVSRYFVRNEDGVSVVPMMEMLDDKAFRSSWDQLEDAILEGGFPFERAYGSHAFEYANKDARFNDVFNKAMFSHTKIVVKKLLDSYKGFEHFNRVVDVGGGLGATISMITSKYPSIKGVNYDLPHVLEHASAYPGVEHVGGDMFESVPKGDAIFLKWILHDWNDDLCVKLLKNCYDAIPANGKVIVFESIPSFVPQTTCVGRCHSAADLFMMAHFPGGRERTKEEFVAVANKAGFGDVKLVSSVFHYSVLELSK